MTKQLVSSWMTTDVITITRNTTVRDALALMTEHGIRRLPVVDDHECLIGIVTEGDLQRASPSDATSLSIHEINYLLDRLTVGEVMTQHPITATPWMSISRVAQIMLENKIGGIPVIRRGKVVGIITESDIFRVLVLHEPV